MPRDQRLYMTFPNDFWMHPKVATLPVEAKWAFVEMNGYSRMQDLDGRIPLSMVARMWSADAVDALINSHAERPLVLVDGDALLIRDYAEHQQTTAAREELHVKRAEAGKAGAEKRWASKPIASAMASAKQTGGNDMTETETETTELPIGSSVPRKRASLVPRDFSISDDMRAWAAENTPLVDVDAKLSEWVDYWTGVGKLMKQWDAVWRNGMRKQQTFAERDLSNRRPTPTDRAAQTAAAGRAVAGRVLTSLEPKELLP